MVVGYTISEIAGMILTGAGIPGSGGLIGAAFGVPMYLAASFLIVLGVFIMKNNGNAGILTTGVGTMMMFFAMIGAIPNWITILIIAFAAIGTGILISKTMQ
jgi:hypothetical protein